MRVDINIPNIDPILLRKQIEVCDNIIMDKLLKNKVMKKHKHYEMLKGILNMLETMSDIIEQEIRIKK